LFLFSQSGTKASEANSFATGVNISGGEFGKIAAQGYRGLYPSKGDIKFYKELGFSILRIPIRWERFQSVPMGEIINDDGTDLDYKWLLDFIQTATKSGIICIIDLHNYGKRRASNGASVAIGDDGVPRASLADFWTKISETFKTNPNVWLGLMNEPKGYSAQDWADLIQETVISLRTSGVSNTILIPGVSWTSAHSWIKSGNGAAFSKFADPMNNSLFEIHQYLDSDSSGTHGVCREGSSKRLDAFAQWSRDGKNRRGFLAEFGAGDPLVKGQESCATEVRALLAKLAEDKDVWAGWTAWGAGRFWQRDYINRLEQNSTEGTRVGNLLRILVDHKN
jgi:endoglucanase